MDRAAAERWTNSARRTERLAALAADGFAAQAAQGDKNYLFDALAAQLRQGPQRWHLVVTLAQAEGAFVTTIEGLSRERSHPVQLALLAGNVVPFLADGTLVPTLRRLRAHLTPDGRLVAGWSLPGHEPEGAAQVSVEAFERAAFGAGLSLVRRHAGWDGERWPGDGSYCLAVLRPA